MALLKDLIVQGASRFIGDAYFATVKAGVWNGTPIDLSHGGTAGTTTANKVLLSTTTSGTAAWSAWTSAGFLKTNASGVISIDTNTYITGNQTITLSGAVSGSGTTSITTSYAGTVPIDKGGTNATTAAGARTNLGTWALISDSYNTLIASDGSTNGWIKIGTSNTNYGLLPSAAGGAGSGHNYIGTSSWYWKYAYIDEIHGSLVGTATYASNVGASGNYVTAAKVIATCNWYDTMIASDTDALINRWNEVVDFLNNFTEADTLASVLSTYVTLGTAQTITGAKTFANPISGDLLGNATTADRLKSTTAVGSASLPVYFTGGLPVACTGSSIFSALSSDVTNAISITVCGQPRNITAATLKTSLGLGTGAFANIADYLPLSGGTMTGSIAFPSDQASVYNSSGIKWSDYTMIGSNTGNDMGIYSGNNVFIRPGVSTDYTKGIVISRTNLTYNGNEVLTAENYTSYVNSTNFPVLGYTLSGVNGRTINSSTAGYAAYYSAASTVSGTSLVTFDTTNKIVTIESDVYCGLEIWRKQSDSYYSAIRFCRGITTKTTVGQIGFGANGTTNTVAANRPYWSTGDTQPTYYQIVHSPAKTVVGGSNTPVYVDANGQLQTCTGLITSGTVNLSGATTIDSLTAGNLIVNGNSSLTGNVSMGTVIAGIWNGSVIDVAHGGTGCSTLTSGSALIGNGTGAVTFRSITNNTAASAITASTNLITANTLAYWNGAYSGTSSRLTYCNKGAFGTAATRAYATAIAIVDGTGVASATSNNNDSDDYVPTNKAVYDFVTTTLAVSPTIIKAEQTVESLNSSTWTETGYTLYGEEQGSYMLQITDLTTGAIFTGVFSIYHSSTNNALDEIPLHMCANTSLAKRIYAATSNGNLLVSSQDTDPTDHRLIIKYKKII